MSEVYVLGIRNLGISEYQIAAKQFDRLYLGDLNNANAIHL